MFDYDIAMSNPDSHVFTNINQNSDDEEGVEK